MSETLFSHTSIYPDIELRRNWDKVKLLAISKGYPSVNNYMVNLIKDDLDENLDKLLNRKTKVVLKQKIDIYKDSMIKAKNKCGLMSDADLKELLGILVDWKDLVKKQLARRGL